mmetsp:Transcript_33674/g.73527  ORF Transcript_33674/g.73527 Transcript_33674/m.73527 type:complete len:326 (-) Transcript_33674:258-1235(-)
MQMHMVGWRGLPGASLGNQNNYGTPQVPGGRHRGGRVRAHKGVFPRTDTKLQACTHSSFFRGLRPLKMPAPPKQQDSIDSTTISMGKRQRDRRERQKGMLQKLGPNKLLENGFLLVAAGIGVATLGTVAAVALPGLIMAGISVTIVSFFLGSVVLPFIVIMGAVVASSLLAGVVLPAAAAGALGLAALWLLGRDTGEEEAEAEVPQEVPVLTKEEQERLEEEEREAKLQAELAAELAEFDRRLLGDSRKWSVAETGAWLTKSGFEELVVTFAENEIDGPTLLTLGTDELRDELGVKALAQRRSLISAISALKQENDRLDKSSTQQ